MMKKIFIFLLVAGAIGVIGSGALDNYVSLNTQDVSKFEGVVSLDEVDCKCDDPLHPGATCETNPNTAEVTCVPP